MGQDVGQDSWWDLWSQDPWGRMCGAGFVVESMGWDVGWDVGWDPWGRPHGAGRGAGCGVGCGAGCGGLSAPLPPQLRHRPGGVRGAGLRHVRLRLPHAHGGKEQIVGGGPFPLGGGPWDPPSPRAPPLVPPQRFGSALVPWGSLQLKSQQFAKDFRPIDERCGCPTCQRWAGFFGGGFLGCGGGTK